MVRGDRISLLVTWKVHNHNGQRRVCTILVKKMVSGMETGREEVRGDGISFTPCTRSRLTPHQDRASRLATDLATNGPTEEVFTTVITLTRSTNATVSDVVYSFHSYYYTIPHILTL